MNGNSIKKRGNQRFNYKKNLIQQKRGQVTIFIIIAVIVVALGVLVYLFYPQIRTTFGIREETPQNYIDSCLNEKIKESVEILSLQGGSIEPENYFSYAGEKVEYLCYTNDYYVPCVVQQPLLKQHIEREIKNYIAEDVVSCFNSLKKNYQKKGYDVSLTSGSTEVELLPEKIVTSFERKLTLTKQETEVYENFDVVLNNNLYELVSIANSIVTSETEIGDTETTAYMNYYHYLKVEKKKQSDGTTIYIITNRDTGNKFQFASRSIVWPPGYGITT